jgi:hypothetical protein
MDYVMEAFEELKVTSLEHQDETEDAQPEQTALGDPQVQVKEEPEEYATAQELTDVYDQLLAERVEGAFLRPRGPHPMRRGALKQNASRAKVDAWRHVST